MALRGSITDEDREFVETWENISEQGWAIARLDSRGDVRLEQIRGPKRFFITTEERLINHEQIESQENDPFLNGAFRPVVVPETVTTETNPNALSDSEVDNVLKSSDLAWDEWMKVIDSPATLKRMMVRAEAAGASLKRYKQVEARLNEVRPRQRIHTTDPTLQNFLKDAPSGTGASSAVDASGNPRRQGGMSSDYR